MREGPRGDRPASEERLDELREEALREGRVDAEGVRAVGGPLPAAEPEAAGYYGMPVIKAPVWTWEIPVYFFVGGLAGMAAVLALAATVTGPAAALEGEGARGALVRSSLGLAAGGALASTLLLVLDLGRPMRFLNMLRVLKWRSPMSVGAWTLAAFGGAAVAAFVLVRLAAGLDATGGGRWLEVAALGAILAAGPLGAVLASYTGVLVAATAVPAWFLHRRLLPLLFGVAGLGSAAAALELLGFRLAALHAVGLLAAAVETVVAVALEARGHGAGDRALREGRSGLLVRGAGLLAGPLALLLRLAGWIGPAALAFLAGSLLARFGWLEAGKASASDPEATFETQRRPPDRGS